jgi:hypothetical protein
MRARTKSSMRMRRAVLTSPLVPGNTQQCRMRSLKEYIHICTSKVRTSRNIQRSQPVVDGATEENVRLRICRSHQPQHISW